MLAVSDEYTKPREFDGLIGVLMNGNERFVFMGSNLALCLLNFNYFDADKKKARPYRPGCSGPPRRSSLPRGLRYWRRTRSLVMPRTRPPSSSSSRRAGSRLPSALWRSHSVNPRELISQRRWRNANAARGIFSPRCALPEPFPVA